MCTKCAGYGHNEDNYFGKQGKLRDECRVCHVRKHITPLCPSEIERDKAKLRLKTSISLCLAQRRFDSCQFLPTMTLTLKNEKKSKKAMCLIDTETQKSYIAETAAQNLCPDVNELFQLDCDVDTYIAAETKNLKQMSTGIKIEDRTTFAPFLVDKI